MMSEYELWRSWATKLAATPTQEPFEELLEEGVRHWLFMRNEAKRSSGPEGVPPERIVTFRSADDIRAKLRELIGEVEE